MPRPVESIENGEFSKLFMDAVIEFYDEWKKENDASLPDFEKAIERAKSQGVLPDSEWPEETDK